MTIIISLIFLITPCVLQSAWRAKYRAICRHFRGKWVFTFCKSEKTFRVRKSIYKAVYPSIYCLRSCIHISDNSLVCSSTLYVHNNQTSEEQTYCLRREQTLSCSKKKNPVFFKLVRLIFVLKAVHCWSILISTRTLKIIFIAYKMNFMFQISK